MKPVRLYGPRRLSLVGCTGRARRLLIERAVEEGHEVRALARRPQALEDLRHDRLEVVEGAALDPAAVARAVESSDAVLSVLGPRTRGDDGLLVGPARSTVDAMRSHGVGRIVWLTGAGVRARG